MKFGNIRAVGVVIATGSAIVTGSAQVSYSGLTGTPSGIISGSAQVDVMSTTNIARLATTGSNTFGGNQTINGSLIVTGSLTAQQFIISSSVTYLTESFASGSHKFGDSSDDTHQFTGSIFLGGSIVTTATGSIGTYTTPTSGGTILTAVGSGSATSAQVFTTTNHASFFEANTNSGSIVSRLQSQNASFVGTLTNNTFDIVAGGNVIIRTTGSGLVGINKSTTPNATLDVNGNTIVSGTFTTTNAGIANTNTYLGTGQLRVGGGSDHGSNTVLSIAPGVVTVDAPGVAGGRLKLDNVGNLGLGTTPTEKLDVYGSIRFRTALQSDSYYATFAQNAYYTGAWVKYSSGYARTIQLGDGISFKISNAGAGNAGDGITFITPLTITDGGNVGINDVTPATKLSINGANYVEMATFTCTNAAAATIITDNQGYVQFLNARHCSNNSLFVAVTNGLQITKSGILHITFSQDIITAGTTGYVSGYIRKNTNTFSENLITNTNGQWDGINGVGTIDVNASDVIGFYFSASDIVSFDPGSWSQYSFIWTSR